MRIVEQAKAEAAGLLPQAQQDAQAKREEADALFEETRAVAARAAADFETNLAKRREQSERDLAARQDKAQKRLTEIEGRAEQLRLEAERLRTDAERRAEEMVTEAQEKAGRILSNEALSGLRRTVAAIIADSRFTPVGGLVEQRATIMRELTELHTALTGWEQTAQAPRPTKG